MLRFTEKVPVESLKLGDVIGPSNNVRTVTGPLEFRGIFVVVPVATEDELYYNEVFVESALVDIGEDL